METAENYLIKINTYPQSRTLYARSVFKQFFEGRMPEDEFLCMDFVKDKKRVKVIKREGSKNPHHVYFKSLGRLGMIDSRDAEAYEICLPVLYSKTAQEIYSCHPKGTYIVAVKIIPLTQEEINYPGDIDFSSWRELKILELLTDYVSHGINPNLPFLYSYGTCRKTNPRIYENKNLVQEMKNWKKVSKLEKGRDTMDPNQKRQLTRLKNKTREFSTQSLLIFNEIADMDLAHWLDLNAKTMTPGHLESLVFQILAGLESVHDEGLLHLDLHLSNVLVSKTNDVIYYYNVAGESYYIPLEGCGLMKIWDFGRCIPVEHASYDEINRRIKKTYQSIVAYPKANAYEIIDENLEKDLHGYFKYVQSYDAMRILSAISTEVRKLTKRSEILPVLDMMDKMVDDAFEDISTGLLKKSKAEPKGTSQTLIKVHFPEKYRNFPETGILANPGKPFKLSKKDLEIAKKGGKSFM